MFSEHLWRVLINKKIYLNKSKISQKSKYTDLYMP